MIGMPKSMMQEPMQSPGPAIKRKEPVPPECKFAKFERGDHSAQRGRLDLTPKIADVDPSRLRNSIRAYRDSWLGAWEPCPATIKVGPAMLDEFRAALADEFADPLPPLEFRDPGQDVRPMPKLNEKSLRLRELVDGLRVAPRPGEHIAVRDQAETIFWIGPENPAPTGSPTVFYHPARKGA
jgi:hypothetical protein